MRSLIPLLLPAPFGVAPCSTDDRPYIVVIMADDMGYADAGFAGGKGIKTPNLDA
ncbi:hypothetical protein Pla175_26040 [Pirellulimonas nuda]|uniref:Arylsulfatase n=1 Tax=Pirellulimonas nuda TaxID=2528009 RepID=A0A518DCK9_9BACT|nr:hypothetical protein [Pirellulimonas nuda]QDU89217.1 hypothetical protein Pla175_26040 [Pirellulimonas nuda]